GSRAHPRPRSFPTRRSSDLDRDRASARGRAAPAPPAAARPADRPAQPDHLLEVARAALHPVQGRDDGIAAIHLKVEETLREAHRDRKSTRLNSSHVKISYAV